MIQYLKSSLFKFLCNSLTGSAIRFIFSGAIPDIRWRGFRFIAPEKNVNKTITASIFWGFYESSEIRFIEQYLTSDLNVIEFGSSLGVVSSHIVSKLKAGKKLIAVEANPFLIETIKKNVERHIDNGVNCEVINKAVSYESEIVNLALTDNNTETRIINSDGNGEMAIPTCRLDDIVRAEEIEQYVLVCDIEGAEIQIFEHEKACLQQCKQLFIELHETIYQGKPYTVEDMLEKLSGDLGFRLVDRHGPVCVFEK